MNRYCPNCGQKIPSNATFCPNCGHSLLENGVNRFQNVPNQAMGGYNNSTYYRPQPYGNNYTMGYFPGHPIRRWSFKAISIIVILAMIFCYVVFHLYYQHTMPSDMKGTTVSGTKMLSAPAPAKNTKNNRNHPRTIIKDYSPTEYFYDEAFFGEYSDNEPNFYSNYDSNNEFNYNTVNNASDTFNRNTQNNSTTQKQNNTTNNKSRQTKNANPAGTAKDKIFMKPSTGKRSSSEAHNKNASDNSDNSASDNSNDSSDNLSDSSNNNSDSNSNSSDNSSDSNSDSNSNSSDSSNNSSDSSSNSSDSNNSDSNSNSSDSNNSDSNSDSNNGSDSDQSYHPDDSLFLDPLNSNNNSGHQVNAQLSYTIEPHSIIVDMRLGKVQKEVTYSIEHIHRYDNNRVEFTVAGSGKYAKYHSFTFTRGSGNQYEIDAVNGSHVSAEHFNNGQLSITKGNR